MCHMVSLNSSSETPLLCSAVALNESLLRGGELHNLLLCAASYCDAPSFEQTMLFNGQQWVTAPPETHAGGKKFSEVFS